MSTDNDRPVTGFADFFEVSVPVEASRERLYELVTNIEGLAEFFPSVSFKLDTDAPLAVGSTYRTRQKGSKSWVPYRVLALDTNARMSAELVGKDPLFERLRYDHRFETRGGTTVSIERVDYTFRYGLAGRILNYVIGKRLVRKQVLDAHKKLREVATTPRQSAPMSHAHGHGNMSAMDATFWNELYRSKPKEWNGRPHPHLVTEAEGLTPGSALDVGTGEGADALWLAERGWQVTAVDISSVALERGTAQAVKVGAGTADMITWLQADLTEWVPPVGNFDLVSAQYFHLASAERDEVYERLADAVAPGGVLLIVGHHPSDLETTAMRLPDPDPLFTPDDIADELGAGWNILVAESIPRSESDRSGDSTTVHDSVLVARRTG